jgi:hypothetical protein
MRCAGERGTALIMTLVFSITFAGLASTLLLRVHSEAKFQGARNNRIKALNVAFGGINIAMVQIGASDYTAGPSSDRNAILYNADSTDNGTPGNYIVDNGTYKVQVNNLGDLWYEIVSTSTVGEDTREIKLRVREKDYFSRYSLFAENGHVVVDDTNRWHGAVHVNREVRFRNRISGTYAKFYDLISSCEPAKNYAESGGYQETRDNGGFIGGERFSMKDEGPPDSDGNPYGWVELPDATALSELGTTARAGSSQVTHGNPYDEALHGAVWEGPNGISVELGTYGDSVKTYIEFKDTATEHRVVKVTRKYGNQTVFCKSFTLPWEGLVHVEGNIHGIKGDVNSRTTVVSETGYVNISDDICYVDDKGRPVYLYDKNNPESEDNFTLNPDYMKDETGEPRVLAIMAKKDIIFLNQDGDQTNDHDLCISAVLASGIGGTANDGGVCWLDAYESREGVSWNDAQRDLRLLGAMIADGASNGWAHFKGWSLGGGGHGGYNNSVFFYDDNIRSYVPPHFLEVEIPLYSGLEITK